LGAYISGTADTYRLLQEQQFPAFSERHAGVTVELTPGLLDLTKLRTLAAGGDTPDLYMAGASYAPVIAEGKYAVALDERLKAWGQLGDFFPASLTASEWGGKRWGLPMIVSNRVHIWRRQVLAEAGFAKTPTTWEEVVDASRRSTKTDGGAIVREGNTVPDSWAYFVACLLSVGKTLFRDNRPEFTGPEGIAAMEYLLDIYSGIRPPGATPPAASNAFANGTQAHTWGNMGNVLAVAQVSQTDLGQLMIGDPPVPGGARYKMPAGTKVRPVSPNFSDWIAVGSLSKAQDQAWALAKFLLEPEPLLAYSASRYSQPPRKSVANQGFMREPLLQRNVEVFDKYGQTQIRVPDTPRFQEVMRNAGEELYAGKASARQAVDQAARLLQAEVDKTGVKWTTL
jgi:multiple sugar transport system substrate-binding protein